jgi:glucose-1-phosphate thymidylyltransferase
MGNLVLMKGIVLAGGSGSRLWPVTLGVSKQLLPVYDKPMIHYPISTLMLAQIREILIITRPEDKSIFEKTLGNGSQYGVSLSYATQEFPNGLVEAFTIGQDFVGLDSVALILGDNIFYGQGLGVQLSTLKDIEGAHIFAYKVSDPERYGVIEFDSNGRVISLEEKPSRPKSRFAVPGLYFYDNSVFELAESVRPSSRGELEITALNQIYLELGKLQTTVLERGTAWLDTGTFDSLHAASSFIKAIEDRQGFKIACLEEIGWRNSWISEIDLKLASDKYRSSPFGQYLRDLLQPPIN